MNLQKDTSLAECCRTYGVNYIIKYPVRMLCFIIISAVLSYSINLFFHQIIIPSAPEYTAGAYADCLKKKDYKGAAEFFCDIPGGQMMAQKNIENAVQNLYGGSDDIRLEGDVLDSDNNVYSAVIDVYRGSGKYPCMVYLKNTESSLLGFKKEWKVVFPFKVTDIGITGFEGTRVYIDGIDAGTIQNGELNIKGIICEKHLFNAEFYDMASMKSTWIEVNEDTVNLTLNTYPSDVFRKSMEDLITGFCEAWSQYCLSQDHSCLKPYLTERLYKKYAEDTDIFQGSRFLICEYTAGFGELSIEGSDDISLAVDEKWHLKEEITDDNLLFRDNGGTTLEQNQNITWKYNAVKENGIWKLDGVQQISFKQEIIN